MACLVERVGREDGAELLDAVEEDPLHLAGPVDVVLGRRRRLHLLLRVHRVDHVVGCVDQRLRGREGKIWRDPILIPKYGFRNNVMRLLDVTSLWKRFNDKDF